MPLTTRTTHGHTQLNVPLTVTPKNSFKCPSYIGKVRSHERGLVLHGHNSMDYELPNGALLRIVANHHNTRTQILLLTKDSEIFQQLPGQRPGSMLAGVVAKLHRYRSRLIDHDVPLHSIQRQKIDIVSRALNTLENLFEAERKIAAQDFYRQESLRHRVISILRDAQHDNYQLANHPMSSDGDLGSMLIDIRHQVVEHQFNHFNTVTRLDQHNYSSYREDNNIEQDIQFVWDSELHLDSEDQIHEAIKQISYFYGLQRPKGFSGEHPTRLERFFKYFKNLKDNVADWLDYVALEKKPHGLKTEEKTNGVKISRFEPYYFLEGKKQASYPDLLSLSQQHLSINTLIEKKNIELAKEELKINPGACIHLPRDKQLLFLKNEKLQYVNYFKNEQEEYSPLPSVDDLITLSQISRRDLFFFDRFVLQMRAFITRIPGFFVNFYQNMKNYLLKEVVDDFFEHVHQQHLREQPAVKKPPFKHARSVQQFLNSNRKNLGNKTYQELKKELQEQQYLVTVQGEHQSTPPAYDNPFHRSFSFLRHFSHLFFDPMEKNPLIGSLAMAAYVYGGGAVIAPAQLTALLHKLHLHGLIKGIKPTQAVGKFMSHGKMSEAISSSVTYWQGVIVSGDLDRFFTDAIDAVKDNPAEITIISALAMGLGYGLCEGIPSFRAEMGTFPYINYAAAGAKGGAAIYDTVMHPGDDWLLGTTKWLIRQFMYVVKFLAGPAVEGWKYGFKNGFLNALKKSSRLLGTQLLHSLTALADLGLIVLSFLMNEASTVFIQIPLRGLSSLFSKTLGMLGQIRPWGKYLMTLSDKMKGYWLFDNFRPFPNYGFSSPFRRYSNNSLTNTLANGLMIPLLTLLQMVKNPVLAVLDGLELVVRGGLDLFIPFIKLGCWFLGGALYLTSLLWDPSIGALLTTAGQLITGTNNFIDTLFDELRQRALSVVNIGRLLLYRRVIEPDPVDKGKLQQVAGESANQQSRYRGINFFEAANECNKQSAIEIDLELDSDEEDATEEQDLDKLRLDYT